MTIAYVVFDGDQFVKGGFTAPYDLERQATGSQIAYAVPNDVLTFPDLNLGPLRLSLLIAVDEGAEACRLRFITAGSGQALTYQYKAAEARAFLADHTAETPFLLAESAATGKAVADIAAEVIAQVAVWIAIGAKIEATRTKAKDDVASANDVPALFAAAAIDWSALAARG